MVVVMDHCSYACASGWMSETNVCRQYWLILTVQVFPVHVCVHTQLYSMTPLTHHLPITHTSLTHHFHIHTPLTHPRLTHHSHTSLTLTNHSNILTHHWHTLRHHCHTHTSLMYHSEGQWYVRGSLGGVIICHSKQRNLASAFNPLHLTHHYNPVN